MNINHIVAAVTRALAQAQIDYLIVGSFSSNFYGTPRSTADLDIVVQLGEEKSLADIARFLGDGFSLVRQRSFELFTGTSRIEIEVRGSPFTIELFLLSDDPHDVERFRRRVPATVGGHTTFLPTVEDVIITKLRWGRAKDVDDVKGILGAKPPLDHNYLRHWCGLHGTLEMLHRLLAEFPSD